MSTTSTTFRRTALTIALGAALGAAAAPPSRPTPRPRPPRTPPAPPLRWYGIVEGADEDTLSFDLACYFEGEDALLPVQQDLGLDYVIGPFYNRNDNPLVRDLQVAPGTTVDHITAAFSPAEPTAFADWAQILQTEEIHYPVWVTVEGGQVVGVEEIQTP